MFVQGETLNCYNNLSQRRPLPSYTDSKVEQLRVFGVLRVIQLIRMEQHLNPEPTVCAFNHFSLWPTIECEINTIIHAAQGRHPRFKHSMPLLPLDLSMCSSLHLKYPFSPFCPILFPLWTLTFG